MSNNALQDQVQAVSLKPRCNAGLFEISTVRQGVSVMTKPVRDEGS